MKKIILILLAVVGISYGQARQAIPDTLRAHRTDINANTDSLSWLGDSTRALRVSVNNLEDGIEFTGDVTFGDDDTLTFGAGNDLILYSNGSLGNIGGAGSIYLRPNNTSSWMFNSNGNFTPVTTSTFNIGNSDRYVGRIYADTVSIDTLLSMPDGADIKLGDGSDLQMTFSGTAGSIIQQNANLSIYGTGSYNLYFGTNTVLDWMINSSGDFTPYTNEGVDIGSTSKQVDTVYTEGLKLDGTAITASAAELNYTDGVTSNIQTQLDAKVTTASIGGQIADSIDAETRYANFYVSYPQTGQTSVPLVLGAIQITRVKAVTQGGTSVVFNLIIDNNIDEADAYVFSVDKTILTSVTTLTDCGAPTTYAEDEVDEDYFLMLEIGTVTGTVEGISVVVEYQGQ